MTVRYNITFERTKWNTDLPKKTEIKGAYTWSFTTSAPFFYWEVPTTFENESNRVAKTQSHWVPIKEIDNLEIETVRTFDSLKEQKEFAKTLN